MMNRKLQRKTEKARALAGSASDLFDSAAEKFEEAARIERDVYDELEVQINELLTAQAASKSRGLRADKNAKRLRELFV